MSFDDLFRKERSNKTLQGLASDDAFCRFWSAYMDALERHLDRMERAMDREPKNGKTKRLRGQNRESEKGEKK